jgi:prepilin-type N-terminal cleavage/methylation domain-containing protein
MNLRVNIKPPGNAEFGIRNSELPDSALRTPQNGRGGFRQKAGLIHLLKKCGGLPTAATASWRNPKSPGAFTLIELLLVISIIGVLAAIGLPAIRGMTKSNAIIASNRQFQDDLSLARQSAIASHTTVYVVFVPTNIATITKPMPKPIDALLMQQITNLYTSVYSGYALLEMRQIGEQPGQNHPRYLTGWRSLPSGVFFAAGKFGPPPPSLPALAPYASVFHYASSFPFPSIAANPAVQTYATLPYLAFNYLGQLVWLPGLDANSTLFSADSDQNIPLARGSIFYNPINFAPDVQENPPANSINNTNVIYINALTGRAKINQPQIQ